MVAALQVPDTVYRIPRDVILAYNSKKRVGNYLIGKTIGEGAFAKVKEGLHIITGEKVAIKIIDKNKAKQDNYLWKNLRREVKLLQCMRHPNVVRLYESLETEMAYYLVLELIRGGEMKDYIAKSERLSEAETRKYMRQLISAVWHIHSAGVVHRDLKVENIMLSESGDIKIIDFGLSNCFKSLDSKGGKGTQCGSPAYAAPELLANKGYDSRVDIWAIGINMFAMLVGKLPFKVKPFNLKKLYQKMITCDMEILPQSTSPDARDLLTRLLQPAPNDRISLKDTAHHNWLADTPILFINSPNFPVTEELNQEVLQYLGEFHNVNVHALILDILTHNINTNTATYHYMCNKSHRYKTEQSKGKTTPDDDQTSIASMPARSITSTRRPSKSKIIKRRPKTAGTFITKRETPDPSGSPSPAKQAGGRVHSLPGGAVNKKPATDRRNSLPNPKEAFPSKTDNRCQAELKEEVVTKQTKSKAISEYSTGSVATRNNMKTSVVSCKAKIETVSITTSHRTSPTDPLTNYKYEQNENTKLTACYNGGATNDGRANWRANTLIKTRYYPSANVVNFRTDYKSYKTVPGGGASPSPGHQIQYSNGGSGNHWAPIRQGSASTKSSEHQRVLTNRPVSSYKWRNDMYRTKLSLSKNSTPVYQRNMTFPDHIYRPQFKTYSSYR